MDRIGRILRRNSTRILIALGASTFILEILLILFKFLFIKHNLYFKFMNELNDFYNDGFGWICRHCEREFEGQKPSREKHSRLLREGEAESKNPRFSNLALAKWTDVTQRTLVCPRCGITELVDKF